MANFSAQLPLPLVAEVGGRKHRQTLSNAAIQKLAGDHRRLDRLPDADIVGDQQAHRLEPQRHDQRYELIGSRHDRDTAK
jgi:hypothetical protein